MPSVGASRPRGRSRFSHTGLNAQNYDPAVWPRLGRVSCCNTAPVVIGRRQSTEQVETIRFIIGTTGFPDLVPRVFNPTAPSCDFLYIGGTTAFSLRPILLHGRCTPAIQVTQNLLQTRADVGDRRLDLNGCANRYRVSVPHVRKVNVRLVDG